MTSVLPGRILYLGSLLSADALLLEEVLQLEMVTVVSGGHRDVLVDLGQVISGSSLLFNTQRDVINDRRFHFPCYRFSKTSGKKALFHPVHPSCPCLIKGHWCKFLRLSVYSPLFLFQKKMEGFRPIIDLKGLNGFISKDNFKMESLQTIFLSFHLGDWRLSIDLKDACFRISIHRDFQKFLRFTLGAAFLICVSALWPYPKYSYDQLV